MREENVGEHRGTDKQLKPLPAFSQTTLHAPSPEQDRDAALNARAEPLSFFEGGTVLDGGAFGGFVSAPRGIEISSTPACWQAVRLLGL